VLLSQRACTAPRFMFGARCAACATPHPHPTTHESMLHGWSGGGAGWRRPLT